MQDPQQEIAEIMGEEKQDVPEAPPQEEVSEPPQEEEASQEASQEADDDVLEIEGMEELPDGRIKYTLGNSVYFSAEGLKGNKAVSDVLRQASQAALEKDKAYQEMKKLTTLEKAKAAIKLPKTLDEEDEEKLPQIPERRAIISHVLKDTELEPKMLSWTVKDWVAYGDSQGLHPMELAELKQKADQANAEVLRLEDHYTRQYNTALALRQSRDDIREILANTEGINPDDFAAEYHEILKRGLRGEGLNQYKELDPRWVVKEFSKVISKTLTARQKSKLEAEVQKKILESKEQRRKAIPVGTTAPFKKTTKAPTSIAQATKEILAEITGGR
jgi:hypothetical protein